MSNTEQDFMIGRSLFEISGITLDNEYELLADSVKIIIVEAEKLRAKYKKHDEFTQHVMLARDDAMKQVDELRAKNEELRAQVDALTKPQEPFAYYTDWHPDGRKYAAQPHGFDELGVLLDDADLIREVWLPLFDHPTPSPLTRPAVPETEVHEPKCPALDGGDCICTRGDKQDQAVDRSWARFCAKFGDGPDAPYPGMISAFERYYGQSFADKEWRTESAVWAAAWKAALLAEPQPKAAQNGGTA